MYSVIKENANKEIVVSLPTLGLLLFFVMSINLGSYLLWGYGNDVVFREPPTNQLYLLNEASIYVHDVNGFENKVQEVAHRLEVPAEWLMAVMYSESKFDASVSNHKGSGATGLIQWMPATAKDFGITVEKLRNLNHVEQMEFVYTYLNNVRKKYGKYASLTELYLAILYPKALQGEQDFCYTLYATPSAAYKMNSGLDEDRDGRVTVRDIDRRMQRIYMPAYAINKDGKSMEEVASLVR